MYHQHSGPLCEAQPVCPDCETVVSVISTSSSSSWPTSIFPPVILPQVGMCHDDEGWEYDYEYESIIYDNFAGK